MPAHSGDFILVGDLMKSLTLLVYKAAEGSLEVRARDLDSKWLTALATLDDDTYALADNSHNLVRSVALGGARVVAMRVSGSWWSAVCEWLHTAKARTWHASRPLLFSCLNPQRAGGAA